MSSKRVYFIQAASGGPIKIGIATSVKTRLQGLQSGFPAPLAVLAHKPGGEAEEARLHSAFASTRVRGEWFEDTPELRAEIAIAGGFDQTIGWLPTVVGAGAEGRDLGGELKAFMLTGAPIALIQAFPQEYHRAHAVADAAGCTPRCAQNWLGGKNLPGAAYWATLCREAPAFHAFHKVVEFALAHADEHGTTIADAVAAFPRANRAISAKVDELVKAGAE